MRIKNLENILIIFVLNLLIIFSVSAQNRTDANGKKQGKWVKYKNSSKFYEGQFVDDIPVGKFNYYYPSGHLKICIEYFENGRLNRTKIFFDADKEKLQAQGNYLDKKKDSVWNYYNEKEHLIAIENYRNGLKHGEFKVFNQQGQLTLVSEYERDTLLGQSKEYYENGALFRIISYEKGMRSGLFELFYAEGNLLLKGNYKKDVRDSIWTTYSESGNIDFLDYYFEGVLKKRIDKNGNKLEIRKEEVTNPLNIDPSVFDPTALKR